MDTGEKSEHCILLPKWKWKLLSQVWLSATPWTIQSMEFSRPEYWSGSLSLLQETFPTQWSNPGLAHCRWILYQLSHKGSPRILEWGAYPFSIGSSQPRNQTGVSCIAGKFFTNCAMREAKENAVVRQELLTSWGWKVGAEWADGEKWQNFRIHVCIMKLFLHKIL